MSTHTSVPSLAQPMLVPKGHTAAVTPDRHSQPASPWEASFGLPPDQYQVALVSMSMRGLGDNCAKCDAAMPHMLLLPLTWDDLRIRIRSDGTPPQPESCDDIAQFGEVWIDFQRHETRRAGHPVELTAFEFKVLKFFLTNPYRVISRKEFLDRVWGYNCYPTTRSVDNRILCLRHKLESEPANPVHFQTVHGVGYKFVP